MLTWNLWWRFGDWRARREAILAVLAELRPDVCGLQEVWGTDEEDLAGWLGERLGMRSVFAASPSPGRWQQRLAGGEAEAAFGNAVLSRWPILASSVTHLPEGPRPEGRTALHTLLDVPGGPLPFTTTHLSSSPAESALRVAQVRALVPAVARHAADVPGARRPVLTGDFNAEAGSDEMRLAGGYETASVVDGFVLVDAWRYAADGAEGRTWDRRNPHVARVHQPSARIDHVLVGLPEFSGRGAVLDVRRVGAEPVDGVWPSDHAAVCVDLAL
ncbi:endonuclease/exonuclease/phosphatase family metal-dependent hydrolase [Kineococcus xinjiangensis]|uniref:Endonuclease/exonuclease/phosphatase family metal-dependent hydrolase n=1 Tax=Kineococcus xinjiangensis TaxID=512762 RepID=A0A2S6IVX2_9ACTN|nr:endonuclease/exonuclease/phosphatase family metal-dependent hydrolase [Kineococcus xinjiangensis]